MDFYPRLLVDDFAVTFGFYRELLGFLTLARGSEAGPYASWDRGEATTFALFDRAMMAASIGAPAPAPRLDGQDTVALVLRVEDVDIAVKRAEQHGATVVTPPTDRPEWGPNLRSAHLRDPEGNLL